jgi:hypothetical protein
MENNLEESKHNIIDGVVNKALIWWITLTLNEQSEKSYTNFNAPVFEQQ